MAVTYNNSAANVNYLSAKTGLAPSVASAWLTNEGQSVANPTNPLNIIKGGTPNQTGSAGAFGTYASPQAGLDAAAWLLKANSAYQGILNAIKSGTPVQQAQAIQSSPWAAGHYGNHNISDMVSPTGSTVPSGGASTPLTSTPNQTNPVTGSFTANQWNAVIAALGWDSRRKITTADKPQLVAAAKTQGIDLSNVDFAQFDGKYLSDLRDSLASQGTIPGVDLNPLNLIPDITGAVMFIGVVAVGAVLILTGGIITLKRK